ncbi:hypothetical protein FRC00_000530, partial [Tulasnella sp. 408]
MAHASTAEPQNSLASKAYQIVEHYDGTNRASAEQQLRDILASDQSALARFIAMLDEDDGHREKAAKEPRRGQDHPDDSTIHSDNPEPLRPEGSPPGDHGIPHRSKRGKSHDDQSSDGRRKRRRHKHRPSPPSSPSDSSSDSDPEPRHNRPDSTLFPWAAQPAVRPELDHRAILERTMAARNNFTKGGR